MELRLLELTLSLGSWLPERAAHYKKSDKICFTYTSFGLRPHLICSEILFNQLQSTEQKHYSSTPEAST